VAKQIARTQVYYDIMIEQSESDPAVYTWEQFIVELQGTLSYYLIFFVRRATPPYLGYHDLSAGLSTLYRESLG
jgi:hypothetical protein